MRAVLEQLKPKVLSLSSERPMEALTLEAGDCHATEAEARIRAAKFTGKGDEGKVVGLYRKSQERINDVLQKTLALSVAEEPEAGGTFQDMPHLYAPPAPSLKLAEGQLLLLPRPPHTDEDDDAAARHVVGVVGADGGSAVGVVSDQRIWSADGGSHQVLPWRPTAGWDEGVRRDIAVLHDLRAHMRPGVRNSTARISARAAKQGAAHTSAAMLTRVRSSASPAVAALAPTIRKHGHSIQRLADSLPDSALERIAVEALRSSGGMGLRSYCAGQVLTLRLASGWIDVEVLEAAAIASHAAEHRLRAIAADGVAHARSLKSFEPEAAPPASAAGANAGEVAAPLTERLTQMSQRICLPLRTFVSVSEDDAAPAPATAPVAAAAAASVDSVRLDVANEDFTLALHPWNHAPRELPSAMFDAVRAWYVNMLRERHSHVLDALTGRRLDVREQCVAIDVSGSAELAAVKDASSLSRWLRALHVERCLGGEVTVPAAVLLTAGPAAGKTSLLSHVIVEAIEAAGDGGNDEPLIPVLIRVQLLQSHLLDAPGEFVSVSNWVDAYLRREYSARGGEPCYRMLRQAMSARRVLVLLDGLDEGGAKRESIEEHVTQELVRQGHVILATSRPDGIDESRFHGWRRLGLSPLSEAQQREALERRLGAESAPRLLPYLERMPIDDATGLRITSNPLMLSMVASMFELRGTDLEMPRTIVELYELATQAMLARVQEGAPVELTPLVRAIFHEAHIAKRRVITDHQLDAAARALKNGTQALDVLRERAKTDRVPLLTLLQARPLQLQAAHLSFQEFFAARALCAGATLPTTPWQLPAWWRNTLRLGLEMGEPFLEALLAACGDRLRGRQVRVPALGGDRPTSASALGAALLAATDVAEVQVSRGGACIPMLSFRRVASGDGDGVIDLSDTKIGGDVADLEVVAGLLSVVRGPSSDAPPTIKLAPACVRGKALAAFVATAVPSVARLDLRGPMSAAQQRAVGRALLASTRAGRLDSVVCETFDLPVGAAAVNLAGKRIGSAAAVLLAGVMKFSAVLTSLDISRNGIGAEGVKAMASALGSAGFAR